VQEGESNTQLITYIVSLKFVSRIGVVGLHGNGFSFADTLRSILKHIYSHLKEFRLHVLFVVCARALALAPFVDRGLRWFTVKFNFKSEGRVKY